MFRRVFGLVVSGAAAAFDGWVALDAREQWAAAVGFSLSNKTQRASLANLCALGPERAGWREADLPELRGGSFRCCSGKITPDCAARAGEAGHGWVIGRIGV